jgi:hypothetical protein
MTNEKLYEECLKKMIGVCPTPKLLRTLARRLNVNEEGREFARRIEGICSSMEKAHITQTRLLQNRETFEGYILKMEANLEKMRVYEIPCGKNTLNTSLHFRGVFGTDTGTLRY